MYKVTNKLILAQDIKRIDISAPEICRMAQPGQFVMIQPRRHTKQIPMTIIEKDERKGSITLIVHEVGLVTKLLGALQINEEIPFIMGPLGRPSKIEKLGSVVVIATGIGAAQILPMARAFKKAGNKIIGIMGAKTKKLLMLEAQMRVVCDELKITTNDGSYEKKGLATDILSMILERQTIHAVYAIGSVDMMKAASAMTKDKAIKTFVYLNTMMLNGLGLCGACRVQVAGQERLACIDGPEFDGHQVNFDELEIRTNAYKELDAWGNLKSSYNPKKDESGIFPRLLSGLAKSRR